MTPLAGYPEPLRRVLLDAGPRWAADIRGQRDRVWAAFEPVLRAAPRDGVTVVRDLAYGAHARQRLDVYRPGPPASVPVQDPGGPDGVAEDARRPARRGAPDAARPIVVFVHGGAFVRGERDISDVAYGNVLTWFARHGWLGINLEYRLAPEATWPAGTDDVARAVRWLHAHAAQHGGDASRIVLVGHSAGGTHVASYAFDPNLAHGGRGVQAVVLLSARLRADRHAVNPNAAGVEAYFGRDEEVLARRSPVTHAHASDIPVLIAVAQFENPLLDVYGAEMAARLGAARGHLPRFLQLAGHNHVSMVAQFNSGDDALGREILAFCEALPPCLDDVGETETATHVNPP